MPKKAVKKAGKRRVVKNFPLRLSDEQRRQIDESLARIRERGGPWRKYSLNDWLVDAATEQLEQLKREMVPRGTPEKTE